MTLQQIIDDMDYTLLQKGDLKKQLNISDIIYDSRKMVPQSVFVCIKGAVRDSHDLVAEVIEQGAVAVVIEHDIAQELIESHPDIAFLQVEDSRIALACLAAGYFDRPANKLITIGITGTKGKTTTSYMIQHTLELAGKKAGVIGTIGAVINGVVQPTANTTPESYEIQRLMAEMVKAGCEYCIMEVSSQGLKLHRVAGFIFNIGLFTNFSSDHIGPNEHASMEEYLYCKSMLFRQCRLGIINGDMECYEQAVRGHICSIQKFGMKRGSDLRALDVSFIHENGLMGMEFTVKGLMNGKIRINIPGYFSVMNALALIAVAKNLNIEEAFICKTLSEVAIKGRMEVVPVCDKFTIIIDYAHNEASIESLLTTIREYKPKRIICVYGSGGNRSKLRRYSAGELCGKMADLSILTSDNPRDEEVSDIIADIIVGVEKSNGKYIAIEDRAEAIRYSMDHAEQGDVILCLGKGHETYQEVKGVRSHFSEREVIEAYREEKYPTQK